MSQDQGLRYNKNKNRYDLLEPFAINELVKVFTKGAEKYEDNNYLKGMKWSKMIASLKRHIAAFENGEDFDFDPNCENCKKGNCIDHTSLYHMAHAAWNCLGLVSYYKYFPQGDDRKHQYLTMPKIGLDIDQTIADWIGGYKKYYGYENEHKFTSWYLHYDILGRCKNDLGNDFYSNLDPLIDPLDINFEPHCYITSRNINTNITQEWLYKHGFPCVPVYTVGLYESKVDVAKKSGIDIFVDDVYKNFVDLNKAGICTFLLDQPHNKRFNVGYKRIKSLKELVERF